MDPTTSAGLGIGGIVAGVLGVLYTYIKHSKCKSNCWGRESTFDLDLTPIKIPTETKSNDVKDGSRGKEIETKTNPEE
jgi:hypothetical protein